MVQTIGKACYGNAQPCLAGRNGIGKGVGAVKSLPGQASKTGYAVKLL